MSVRFLFIRLTMLPAKPPLCTQKDWKAKIRCTNIFCKELLLGQLMEIHFRPVQFFLLYHCNLFFNGSLTRGTCYMTFCIFWHFSHFCFSSLEHCLYIYKYIYVSKNPYKANHLRKAKHSLAECIRMLLQLWLFFFSSGTFTYTLGYTRKLHWRD